VRALLSRSAGGISGALISPAATMGDCMYVEIVLLSVSKLRIDGETGLSAGTPARLNRSDIVDVII